MIGQLRGGTEDIETAAAELALEITDGDDLRERGRRDVIELCPGHRRVLVGAGVCHSPADVGQREEHPDEHGDRAEEVQPSRVTLHARARW